MTETPTRTLITHARIIGPVDVWEDGWLLIEGGRIAGMGPGNAPTWEDGPTTLDAGGRTLLPGFIDLHVHGAMGHEAMDADPDGLRAMARYYAAHGVTGFLPTTWTAAHEVLLRSLAAIDGLVDQPLADGATILGVHLEGPFLNQHRTGAQDVRLIRPAQMERARELLDFGFVRLLALAPEIPENIPLIDECVRRGVTVSAAHTEAGLEEMQVAVAHGLRQVTHCFNAMVGLGHREIGTVGAAMSLPELNVELIADNVHVHPRVQKILYEIKGRDRLILVTDAIRGTGLPDGDYPIDERTIHIENGEVRLPDGTIAGSVLTVNRALAHLTENTGRALLELWPTSSLNAARAIGAAGRKGSLEVGKDADLVLIEPDFGVWRTLVGGRTVYAA